MNSMYATPCSLYISFARYTFDQLDGGTSSFFGLEPKIPVPTRIISLPALSAASKSLDIPMLTTNRLSMPH